MDHVAIMNSKLGLIGRILSGQKTIETRWYKNKISPFNKIKVGETVYFKNSGGPVKAKAKVSRIQQYSNLNNEKCQEIVDQYGSTGQIDIQNWNVNSWAIGKNYAVLIWLKNPQRVVPFNIDKTGFGNGSAWITVDNIDIIRKSFPSGAGRLGNSL